MNAKQHQSAPPISAKESSAKESSVKQGPAKASRLSQDIRAQAALSLYQVVDKGRSLSDVLPPAQLALTNPKDKALLQQLCYGVLRWLPKLDFYCSKLLEKPLKGKQRPFQFLLYVGIYQISEMRIPDHAAISETVSAAQAMKAEGLKGFINGVLRNFVRQQGALQQQAAGIDTCQYGHPNWFIKAIQQQYPQQWQAILNANQQQAPMWLRVNARQYTMADYLQLLTAAQIDASAVSGLDQGLLLAKPMDVFGLPGFEQGSCAVQDGAAQYAAQLLGAQPGDRVLDACAAPGGKTCHILETQAKLQALLAIDADPQRLTRVAENLVRLGLTSQSIVSEGIDGIVSIKAADASDGKDWWDGQLFDRILLDAPCSATGVIRRHPDIKWLRRQDDIHALAGLQRQILDCLWSMLSPGGTLLYATCSVLAAENSQQIKQFLNDTLDAQLERIHPLESEDNPGWQLLPGAQGMDGFYYAKLIKKSLKAA